MRRCSPRRLAIAASSTHVSTVRNMLSRLLTLAWIMLAALTPARAQGGAAPYDRDLQRLSEILGALHYLRALCGAKEGAKWRNEMQALIEAETSAGERRARIVTTFNRGYRSFQQTYRTCAPAADFAIRRYL